MRTPITHIHEHTDTVPFEFVESQEEPIEIYIKSTETNEIMYAASIDDLKDTEQVLKLRPMSLDPDDDDEAFSTNPKIWIRLEIPCTLLVEIINARRPQDNKEDAYASFARLSCNERTYKTKLVQRSEVLEWEDEIFALHFASRTKLETSEIKISIVDWDIEDVVIGSVTFQGGDLADGIHKLAMRGLEDDGDDHVRGVRSFPSKFTQRVPFLSLTIVINKRTTLEHTGTVTRKGQCEEDRRYCFII